MDDLTKTISDTCLCCQHTFDYRKFENLQFGYLETSPICCPCYYNHIEPLLSYAKLLGTNNSIHGDLNSNEVLKKEIALYKSSIRKNAEYAKHLIYPNFVTWCEKMEKLVNQ